MFTTFNVFGFFSRFTFRSTYSGFGNYNDPDIGQTPSQISTDPVQSEVPVTEQPAPIEETPVDTIEISGETPDTAEENPVYNPEDILPAEEMPEETLPATNEEVTESEEPHDNGLAYQIKSKVKTNLSMIFNLAEFDAVISAFSEDAEDGEIDTMSYTDLNIGLHAELDAKARVKEMYRNLEEQEGLLQNSRFRSRSRFSQFESAMMRSRGFEADMFYRDSLRTSYRIRESYHDGFLKVSRKLHFRYKQDFGLSLRALNMFNDQAQALDQTGELGSYLNNTETLVDSENASGALLEDFFGMVESYLEGAEDKLVEKIDLFFENLAAEMGVGMSFFENAQDSLVDSVEDFFDRVDSSLDIFRDRYLPPTEEPSEPEQPEIPEVPLVEMAEAEAAA